MPSQRAFIEVSDLHKTYILGSQEVRALDGVSVTIQRGEFVALTGSSGSGKTTLLNLLGCLDRPTSGAFWLDGQRIAHLSAAQRAAVRSRHIGFVFQNFNLLPRMSAVENVAMPTAYDRDFRPGGAIRKRAEELLTMLGLGERLDHEPTQLSGGQQQRVAIARALINDPALLLADEPTGNLDSKTSQEILDLFRWLNREKGITVVVVTHEAEVAEVADRNIRISDGRVASDTRQTPPSPATSSEPRMQLQDTTWKRGWLGPLAPLRNLASVTNIGLKALHRNRFRSFLTTVGIIIGIAAVIATMEIGGGMSHSLHNTIASMGANTVLVLPAEVSTGGVQTAGRATTLTPEDADAIERECPSVRYVAPMVMARGAQVVAGNRNCVPASVVGTTPSFLALRNWDELYLGEPFTEEDVRRARKVCLIGRTVAARLFPKLSPVGREIRIRNEPFVVMGVLRKKGADILGNDQDDILVAPWTTMKYRIVGSRRAAANGLDPRAPSISRPGGSNEPYPCSPPNFYPIPSVRQQANTPQMLRMADVDAVLVQSVSTESVPLATQEVTVLLAERHRITDKDPDYRVINLAEIHGALQTAMGLFSTLLFSVAIFSLAVGGVGIMNIMLVSVTERTREIGLRMAVGAASKHIMRQFLTECVVLCLLGGFIGIVLGRGTSTFVETLLGWPVEPSLMAAAVAVSVSVTVGVVFGYYPALKASRLDPIEALRYE